MGNGEDRDRMALGVTLSVTANLLVGFLLLGLFLLVAVGAGLGSNPAVDRSNLTCVTVGGLLLLGVVNLPGVGYGLASRRPRFLVGWLVGLGLALLATLLAVGLIAAVVAIVAASAG